MPPDHAARQGAISALAFQMLGKDAAIAFLNTEDAELGGRPLEIATLTEAGRATVQAALEKRAGEASILNREA